MNKIVNEFLLADDKFMPEMYLIDPIVKKYSTGGPFTKHTKRIQNFMQDGKLSHIYNLFST